MDRAAVEASLRQSGCTRIVERRDPPHAEYPGHHHPWDLILVVIDGDLQVHLAGHTVSAKVGDHVLIHAGRRHRVTIGDQGAVYLHAEKPTHHSHASRQ